MFATPDETEAAYYQAFANANLDLMDRVWLHSDHVACVHPLAEQIAGYRLIMASWRVIFEGQGPLPVEFSAREKHVDGHMAVHVGVEVFRQKTRVSTLVTTNVYRQTRDGWRMLLHHASPQPSATVSDDDVLH